MTNSPLAAFFGVGIPHPGAESSSANNEDFDPGAGLGSSSKSEFLDLEAAAIAAASSGEVPNSDIATHNKYRCNRCQIKTRQNYDQESTGKNG